MNTIPTRDVLAEETTTAERSAEEDGLIEYVDSSLSDSARGFVDRSGA